MQEKAIPRPDHAVQRAVLALALAAHPKSLTIPELARDFEAGDVKSAVCDLIGVGLLECGGILPTEAALRHDGLELP